MAIAYQEVIQNRADTTTGGITMVGFAGLAVGNLMIAHIFNGATGRTFTPPAGWTLVDSRDSGSQKSAIYSKIADASDVSGNSWNFGISGAASSSIGAIMRFNGNRLNLVVPASSGQSNGSSTTASAPTITPVEASSGILFVVALNNNVRVSGYTLATSPPTFTELYDDNEAGSPIGSYAAVFGVRPETTATGTASATLAGASPSITHILALSPMPSFTITDTITGTDSFMANIIMFIQDTIAMTEVVDVAKVKWRNVLKHISGWINRDKNL